MKRIDYYGNESLGNYGLIIIKEIDRNERMERIGLFKCTCGNEFMARINCVRKNNTTSCGCKQRAIVSKIMTKHGKTGDLTFEIWKSIKARIFNKNNKGYKYYGGSGIRIFPPWIHDFQLFYDYVSALPNFKRKGYSLDRINNDGNYEPMNLRWVTIHIQNVNQNKRCDNKSGYKGVSRYKDRWQVIIGGKYIGYFKTKEDAVIGRNNYITENNLFEYKIQPIKT